MIFMNIYFKKECHAYKVKTSKTLICLPHHEFLLEVKIKQYCETVCLIQSTDLLEKRLSLISMSLACLYALVAKLLD